MSELFQNMLNSLGKTAKGWRKVVYTSLCKGDLDVVVYQFVYLTIKDNDS